MPKSLPSIVKLDELPAGIQFPQSFAYRGFCPVHLIQNPNPLVGGVPGNSEYMAHYDNKYFTFATLEAMQTFLRYPTSFAALQLSVALPPRPDAPLPTDIPAVGYLESTVAGILNQAILYVGQKKPKYPFQPPKVSAMYSLALYLRGSCI
jgi:hypothetical protein